MELCAFSKVLIWNLFENSSEYSSLLPPKGGPSLVSGKSNSKPANFLVAIFANTVQFVPSAISFIRYHIKHHAFQGVHELDADLPNIFEANLFKNRWWGKALWLFTFPIWQIARTFRTTEIKPFDGWMALNWVWVFGFDIAFSWGGLKWLPT